MKIHKRLVASSAVAILVCLIASGAFAQAPIGGPPGGGFIPPTRLVTGTGDITGVVAGTGLTGGGLIGTVTLNAIATAGGGLTVAADSIGLRTDCTSTDKGLVWDGDSWECVAVATSGGLGVNNTIPKWTGANSLGLSLLRDDASYLDYGNYNFYVNASTGDTVVRGQLYADGVPTTSNPSIFGVRNVGAGSTIDDTPAVKAETYGTWDTTSGIKYAYGLRAQIFGTRLAGAADLNHWALYGRAGTQGEAPSSIQTRIGMVGNAFEASTYTAGATGRGQSATGSVFGSYWQSDTTGSGPSMGSYGFARTGPVRVGVIGNADSGGATTNIGVYGVIGAYSEVFPTGTWAAYFAGATKVTDGLVIGDNVADAHSLTGTLNANATAGTNGQILTVVSGVPAWATPASSGVSGTTNTMAKFVSPSAVGDSTVTDTGSLVTVSNRLTATVNANNVDTLTVNNTRTGNTTSGLKLIKVDATTMTFDLATSKTLYGVFSDLRSPDAAGCGAPCQSQTGLMTNIAVYGNAQNGFANYAGYFDNGNVYVKNSILVDDTLSNSSGGVHAANTQTGITSTRVGIYGDVGGSSNATGQVVSNTGTAGLATAVRSAGTFAVTNIGLWGYASGGQVNRGLWVELGDTKLDGDVAVGDAAGDIATLNGQVQVTNDQGKLSTKIAGAITLTNCGSGATFSGDRTAGWVNTGTSVGSCEVDWTTSFTNTPSCTLTTRSSTKTYSYTADTSKIVMTSPESSTIYDWQCFDHH